MLMTSRLLSLCFNWSVLYWLFWNALPSKKVINKLWHKGSAVHYTYDICAEYNEIKSISSSSKLESINGTSFSWILGFQMQFMFEPMRRKPNLLGWVQKLTSKKFRALTVSIFVCLVKVEKIDQIHSKLRI